jgi:hypothetical protein
MSRVLVTRGLALARRALPAARWAGRLLTRVPEWLWVAVLTAGLGVGGWWLHTRSVELARLQGQADGIRRTHNSARALTATLLTVERVRAARVLDSSRRALTAQRQVVRAQLPTLRRQTAGVRIAAADVAAQPIASPAVDTLRDRALQLADSADTLGARVARLDSTVSADSAAAAAAIALEQQRVHLAGLLLTAQRDSTRDALQQLARRPTWGTVGKGVAVGAVAGGACAVWCDDVARAVRDLLRRRR